MIEQARRSSEQVAEANRVKLAAAQETAFYRAKLSALESANESELGRLERQRIVDLEREVSSLHNERWQQDRKLSEIADSLALQTTLCEQAEARAAEASRRADIADESSNRMRQEHADLQDRHATAEAQLRDHSDRLLSQSSTVAQHQAEVEGLRLRVEELTQSRDQHARAFEQTRGALQTTSSRAESLDTQYLRAREQIAALEADLADLRGELEARTTEVEVSRIRLTDVENSWAKSREEADAFRALTTGSLGELLDAHRDLRADEDRLTRGHTERLQAVEAESSSLRKMMKEATQRLDETQSLLSGERQRVGELEVEQSQLRAQILGLRTQLSSAHADAGRLRKELSEKDAELQSRTKDASNADLRLGMMRNYVSENGLEEDESPFRSTSRANGATPAIAELERKLDDKTRQYDNVERELVQAQRRAQDAEDQVGQLTVQLDRLRTTTTPSRIDSAGLEARAVEAERKLDETEKSYQTRMQQMEEDYQLAVNYVKYVCHICLHELPS
jgi:chromosome segregation ATPase